MTQSIAGQPAPELAVPYSIDAEGKERPPLALKDSARGTGFSFSTSIGAVAATRTDFQLSGRWLNIRTEDVAVAAVQTAFEGAYVNTRDKLPLDQQRYGLRIPFGHEGRSSLGVLPTTMESRIDVAMLAFQKTLDHKLLNRIEALGPPTLENLSRFIFERLRHAGKITRVNVHRDSCNESCTYYGPEG